MKIIFATKNKNKLKEIRKIMAEIGHEIISLNEIEEVDDILEDGETFEENATKKATEIMRLTGQTVIADDSGLEIDFLDKKPGIYSARYLGKNTPNHIKNKKILEIMKDVPIEKRTARFVCAISIAFPDGKTVVKKDLLEGIIAYEENGEKGFGYDPIFFVPEYNMTLAQMTLDMKNNISHRGKALSKIKNELRNE